MQRRRFKIYQSRRQMVLTIAIVLMPLVFLLFFSRLAAVNSRQLFSDISVSFYRIFISYIIAALLGWLFAVSFYRGKRATVALPVFDVLQSFPTFALLPLVTLFWGATNFTVIFFLVITIIWPIFFSIVSSLKLIRRDWEEAAEIYGLRGLRHLKYFVWPLSLPGLVTGSIIGLGEGWEALVATEIIIGVKSGLGDFFSSFSSNSTITFLGIFGLLLLIFSINKLLWLPLLEKSHLMTEE